ncbi:MAG: PAS domain S-box protein, partial [Notoacmeibacter sp.]|nr:PAS domain S-box protein [Notoacmeibacter sp.]
VLEHRRGKINQSFRLRGADGHYQWFTLRARPVIGTDGEVIRCVGTLADVTEQKKAEERLLHDAVHDNLTGLPTREL